MQPKREKPTILVVEDEIELHDLYIMSLGQAMNCLFAVNLQELKEQISKCDAVILDYEIRGHKFDDLLAAVQSKPVMVVTGYVDRLFVRQLTKPFDHNDLIREIISLLNVHHQTSFQLSISENTFAVGDLVRIRYEPHLGLGKIVKNIDARYVRVKLVGENEPAEIVFEKSDLIKT